MPLTSSLKFSTANVGKAIRGKLSLKGLDLGHVGKVSRQNYGHQPLFVVNFEGCAVMHPRNDMIAGSQFQEIEESIRKRKIVMKHCSMLCV